MEEVKVGVLYKILLDSNEGIRNVAVVLWCLKFKLVRHDTSYNGQNQQDSTECLLMLINIIHKGPLPDSSSRTYPIGVSLSDIFFSFVLEKYIVCDACGLRSSSCKSSSVLYTSPTITSSMQNLILQGLQQKLPKFCSRCNKNTWYVESSYILQPPEYILLFVNRLRYIINKVTKDRCSIPMDTTVRLGPLKFSLRATIDHHGPCIHSGHYTASIICCKKKHSIATITQLRSLELLTAKTPRLHMLCYMNWLTHDFWSRTGGWEFDRSHGAGTSSPSHWQQVEEQAPKPVGWMMCFLLMTFVPALKLCVNIYIYTYKCIHMYVYIYIDICALLYEFCFLWLTNCVLLADDNNLIPGCLWLLALVSNTTLILGIWCFTISHLQGCFYPWTFFRILDSTGCHRTPLCHI